MITPIIHAPAEAFKGSHTQWPHLWPSQAGACATVPARRVPHIPKRQSYSTARVHIPRSGIIIANKRLGAGGHQRPPSLLATRIVGRGILCCISSSVGLPIACNELLHRSFSSNYRHGWHSSCRGMVLCQSLTLTPKCSMQVSSRCTSTQIDTRLSLGVEVLGWHQHAYHARRHRLLRRTALDDQ